MVIVILQNLKEKILTVPEYQDIGWIRMNQEPIKQTINAIVSKWLWSSTKTLVSQVKTFILHFRSFIQMKIFQLILCLNIRKTI